MHNGSATAVSHTHAMCRLGVVLFPQLYSLETSSAIFGPEMTLDASCGSNPRASILFMRGGGENASIAGVCLCKHSSTATGLVAPHSNFRPPWALKKSRNETT